MRFWGNKEKRENKRKRIEVGEKRENIELVDWDFGATREKRKKIVVEKEKNLSWWIEILGKQGKKGKNRNCEKKEKIEWMK